MPRGRRAVSQIRRNMRRQLYAVNKQREDHTVFLNERPRFDAQVEV